MLSDVQIAKQAKLEPINTVGQKIGLLEDDLELYGKYKAKISFDTIKRVKNNRDGKLILVTAINPTAAGEGKTTTTLGLHQALFKMGKKSLVAMREPSLGPCFGIKGGAAGGGYAQVVPMEDINLHFTGDFHAITSANNLICAMLDNSIYQGNILNIDPNNIVIKRVVDLNDRTLRNIVIGLGSKNGVTREDGFDISVASELMAILCLATDLMDLKRRIGRMIIAYTCDLKPIVVDDIKGTEAATILMKDAIKPNLVQTLDNAPVIIHGGPFANIAHGCNSLIATKLALKLSDYTITEAGFGADLGAEKFLDIKCVIGDLKPDATVIVATCRALKLHGGVDKKELNKENLIALEKGIENLEKHIENIAKYNIPSIVAINVFPTDTKEEIELLKQKCISKGAKVAISTVWEKGAEGGIELANLVIDTIDKCPTNFKPIYKLEDSIENKVNIIAKEIYGANNVNFDKSVLKKIQLLNEQGFDKLPICIAKTQYSLSDNPLLLGKPKDFSIHVKDIIPAVGAGFLVAIAGNIMRMPGLPKVPAACNMTIDEDGNIEGLF